MGLAERRAASDLRRRRTGCEGRGQLGLVPQVCIPSAHGRLHDGKHGREAEPRSTGPARRAHPRSLVESRSSRATSATRGRTTTTPMGYVKTARAPQIPAPKWRRRAASASEAREKKMTMDRGNTVPKHPAREEPGHEEGEQASGTRSRRQELGPHQREQGEREGQGDGPAREGGLHAQRAGKDADEQGVTGEPPSLRGGRVPGTQRIHPERS